MITLRTRLVVTVVGLGLLACLASCGKRAEGPPLYPVRGELYVASQPAAGAMLILHPASSGAESGEWPSGYPRAFVKEDGSFAVSTLADEDGAPPGEYVALVQWLPTSAGDAESDAGAAKDRLKGRYMNPKTSPLRVKVEERPNDIPRFDLP
jgi:hypothetical protein